MDYLHAGYITPARWGPGPSDTFTMRWYRASTTAGVYLGVHAFGSQVDAGCQSSDTTSLGELPPRYRVWSPSGPMSYDGSTPAVVPAYLRDGPPSLLMHAPCVEGVIALVPTATAGFGGVSSSAASTSGASSSGSSSSSGGGGSITVQTLCCSQYLIPSTLSITFQGTGDCSCVNGSHQLVYIGNGTWSGTFTLCGIANTTAQVACRYESSLMIYQWEITMLINGVIQSGTETFASTSFCAPLVAYFPVFSPLPWCSTAFTSTLSE